MNLGIVGAGTIVPDFLVASSHVKDIKIRGISGQEKDLEVMEKLANQYRIDNVYTDYKELLKSEIEIVYVAVPNHLHYQFAKEALESGKHVLLEKPFASTYQQAEELLALAKANNIAIFEAISNQYLPNYNKTKELLASLGDVKIVQLNYSQYSRRYDAFKAGTILPVFNPHMSGGALMDLNVYNIHFIVGLFGEPSKVRYIANIEKEIDTSGILTLEYPTFQCVAIGAKDCQSPVSINIQGDKGFIHSDDPANVYNHFVFGMNTGTKTNFELNKGENRLYFEIEKFISLLKQNNLKEILQYNQHSLKVMKILDEARRQVGIKI